MSSRFPRRLARISSASLLLAGIGYLQTARSERDLVWCFPGYIAIAIAGLVGLAVSRRHGAQSRLALTSTALFFAYLITRSLFSPDEYVARFDLYLALAATVVYATSTFVFPNSNDRFAIIVVLLAFGIVHVAFSVVQARVGENLALIFSPLSQLEYSDRPIGLYNNPDHLAGLLELIAALGLGVACWSRWPNWARVVVAYLSGTCYFGLIFTASRGGYLSAAFSLIVFLVVSLLVLRSAGRHNLIKFGGLAVLLSAAVITVTWIFFQHNPKLSDRIAQLFTDPARIDLWRAAIDQWRLNPIFGTGSGTYQFYGREFRRVSMQSEPGDVHNEYLTLLCEYGAIGALLFAIFFIAHLREGWRNIMAAGPNRIAAGATVRSDRLALNIGALAATAAYVVHSAVDFNLHVPPNALVLAFIFGIFAQSPSSLGHEAERTAFVPQAIAAALALLLLIQSSRLLPGELYAEKARVALRDEHPESAIRFAMTALQHEQRNPKVYFYLGRALRAISSSSSTSADERVALYERALTAFDHARQLAPLDGNYTLDMGALYDKLGRFAEAEWMYDIALSRDPRSESVMNLYELHLEAWEKGATEQTQ